MKHFIKKRICIKSIIILCCMILLLIFATKKSNAEDLKIYLNNTPSYFYFAPIKKTITDTPPDNNTADRPDDE